MQEHIKISPELSFAILCLIPEQNNWGGDVCDAYRGNLSSCLFCQRHYFTDNALSFQSIFARATLFSVAHWIIRRHLISSLKKSGMNTNRIVSRASEMIPVYCSGCINTMFLLQSFDHPPYDKLELHLHEPWKSKIGSTPSGGGATCSGKLEPTTQHDDTGRACFYIAPASETFPFPPGARIA